MRCLLLALGVYLTACTSLHNPNVPPRLTPKQIEAWKTYRGARCTPKLMSQAREELEKGGCPEAALYYFRCWEHPDAALMREMKRPWYSRRSK